MPVPNTFANATATIPLSQLDANFATTITLGNTAIQLGNTVTTLNNMTLANVTVTSGNVTITNVSVTTANVTTANIATAVITTANVTTANITTGNVSGNLTFTGTGNRITGDFSNATVANRVMFQTSTANSATVISAIPNGTGTVSAYALEEPAALTTGNSSSASFNLVSSTDVRFTSGIRGTGTYLPMTFYTGGSERLRIDSSGNLGLGVTPSAWNSSYKSLDINTRGFGIAGASDAGTISINSFLDSGSSWRYKGTSSFRVARYDQFDGSHFWFNAPSGTAGNAITFTQAMTLDASGRLGIGTTSPFYTLQVEGSSTGGIGLAVRNTNGTGTNALIYAAGSTYASFGVTAYDAWFTNESAGANVTIGPVGAANVKFVANGSERMRLDANGNLGLGRTPSTRKFEINAIPVAANQLNGMRLQWAGGDSAAAELLLGTDGSGIPFTSLRTGNDGNSFMTFFTGSGPTERVRITSGGGFTCAGIYNSTVGATNRDVFVDNGGVVGYVSSIRASKTNIQDLTDTSWLHQLNPVTFHYRKKDEEGNYTDETDGDIQYGMIAEDVEQVRPDLCFYDEVDGEQELRGIQYSKLVPVLLKAIQEQQAMIDELKAKVAALENA